MACRFHRDVDEQRAEMPVFEISTEHQALNETRIGAPASALGAAILQTIAVCDVHMLQLAHISNEEEFRFQVGVSVYGLERDQHNGEKACTWGGQPLHHRRSVRLWLVNVGSTSIRGIDMASRLSYKIMSAVGEESSKGNDAFEEFERIVKEYIR